MSGEIPKKLPWGYIAGSASLHHYNEFFAVLSHTSLRTPLPTVDVELLLYTLNAGDRIEGLEQKYFATLLREAVTRNLLKEVMKKMPSLIAGDSRLDGLKIVSNAIATLEASPDTELREFLQHLKTLFQLGCRTHSQNFFVEHCSECAAYAKADDFLHRIEDTSL